MYHLATMHSVTDRQTDEVTMNKLARTVTSTHATFWTGLRKPHASVVMVVKVKL